MQLHQRYTLDNPYHESSFMIGELVQTGEVLMGHLGLKWMASGIIFLLCTRK